MPQPEMVELPPYGTVFRFKDLSIEAALIQKLAAPSLFATGLSKGISEEMAATRIP